MAWLGKVSLGNFSDLAGAVTKLSESVKNIEKNFDSALGFEEKSESGEASAIWPSGADRKALFEPVMSFMGHKSEENTVDSVRKSESSGPSSSVEEEKGSVIDDALPLSAVEQTSAEEENEAPKDKEMDEHQHSESTSTVITNSGDMEPNLQASTVTDDGTYDSYNLLQQEQSALVSSADALNPVESKSEMDLVEQSHSSVPITQDESDSPTEVSEQKTGAEATIENGAVVQVEALHGGQAGVETETLIPSSISSIRSNESPAELIENNFPRETHSDGKISMVDDSVLSENGSPTKTIESTERVKDFDTADEEQNVSSRTRIPDSVDSAKELEKVKMEMQMMEAALLGAARQAQVKADEIAKLMNENEQLRNVIEDLKKKSNDSVNESLREEYHQRVAALERKVYSLTKERDTLRREQNKKSDAAALLKEKDEIITQVMAEGEELSKKQAAQESTIRKLRAQIREFEEEKKGLLAKLQGEENKVESIKKDKAATEKFLQETIEKHQAELATQKEHYMNALNAAREAEALAEARANNEARTEIESRLREAEERESTLVQTLEELRQTLSRKEQQAVFREDMLQREIDDLQKRYQASERRCEELITQVPESTRPLLRQIEAMQETTARRAEAWAGVERTMNARLQEAEAKAAAAEENERTMNERLSQTLSRMAVLEAQVSCLRAEQTQLTRSLEKERQRASENKQEYLAAQEAVATLEVRAKQFEEEMRELKRKHKKELQELMTQKELLQQELDVERTTRLDLERLAHPRMSSIADQAPSTDSTNLYAENGAISKRKLSSAGSLSSMEESFFLQASLDSSDSPLERKHSEASLAPYFLKSMTPSALEATLRQKDGELASYMSRLASLESIRDSLAEELVKMTAQCEKLRTETAFLPGLRAELEGLRRRHSAALELMGERDEELEELRADIVDLKEMYREQVNLLVNKIQILSSSMGTATV